MTHPPKGRMRGIRQMNEEQWHARKGAVVCAGRCICFVLALRDAERSALEETDVKTSINE